MGKAGNCIPPLREEKDERKKTMVCEEQQKPQKPSYSCRRSIFLSLSSLLGLHGKTTNIHTSLLEEKQ